MIENCEGRPDFSSFTRFLIDDLPDFEVCVMVTKTNSPNEFNGQSASLRVMTKQHQFRLGGWQIFIDATEGVEFFREGNLYKTGSPDSNARYFMKFEEADHLVLGQVLLPWSRTSHHRHPWALERFTGNLLGGELFVYHQEEVKQVGEGFQASTSEKHMLFTLEQAAVNIVHLVGISTDHEFFEQPSWDYLEEKVRLLKGTAALL